ncbi:J domain-containing protein [Sandaracinobacter sp. RS1-74]|uniref:DnaJ C-terminal domain-containing protein n=1 Tax=Sandaracinobacteroides sayramensis TaxID=2913411 RepID=UPI001EDC9182|nr:J domain-containing protein [Sandaracinobacteroides sayramensis]MCG2839691.1 J domain-containing protein [Sandaracinobacteroides sayramensis]
MADLYSVLGVPRAADAAAIKRAYRKLAKQYHPDKNKDNAEAADRFKQVTAAYDILSDEKRRGEYDRGEIDEQGNPKFAGFGGGTAGGFRGAGPRPGGRASAGAPDFDFDFGGDTSDLFSELFGRAQRGGVGGGGMGGGFRAPPQRGADVSYRLTVSFTDAALARTVRLALRNGKTIDLNIPKGVEEGRQLRLAGQGDQGPAGAGDAIVTITIQPDGRFTRDRDDIRADIHVPLETAVLGGKQRVPTPEGEVMLSIAPGTSSGKVMRLKAKGWTLRDGSRGDLLARVLVDVPDDPELADFLRGKVRAG